MVNEMDDQAARLAALNPASSFIVQAPAGSGKTELLIRRYLSLLATVERPEEIVAITFTRKAASEMRARVIDALQSVGNDDNDVGSDVTAELASTVLERDAQQGWGLRDNPRRMQIQTIDALSARLTRMLPLLSRFGVQPEILEDARELYREAARQTVKMLEVKRWQPSLSRLLAHIDNDVSRLEELLAMMLGRRDQWLRHIHSGANRDSLEKAIRNVTIAELTSLSALIPTDLATELMALASFAAGNVALEDPGSSLCVLTGKDALPAPKPEMVNHWRALGDLLLTNSGGWRRAVDKRIGFPAVSAGRDAEEKASFNNMKQRYTALVQAFTEIEGLLASLSGAQKLPPPDYSDRQWKVLEALFEVLQLAAANLWLGFGNHGRIDFQGVSGAALEALGGLDEPSNLALALDYRILHILVDEFQDTSVTQYELLARLTRGWGPDDGHSLFLVGDPMQSIYRFREAEVGLFLRTRKAQRLGDVPLIPLTLTRNFRSRPGLVRWVNGAFAAIFPENPDLTTGAVDFAASAAVREPLDTANVTVHPLLTSGAETKAVLRQIAATQKSHAGDSIAVLVRNRLHLATLVSGLHRRGIRYKAVEIETLGERAAVQDLMALTRALLHPADRIAWLSVLRAPWCGLALTDLDVLSAADRVDEMVIWDSMWDLERCAGLSQTGLDRMLNVRAVFATAFAERRRLPLARWVEGVWLALGGPATVEDPEDLDNARSFFEQLRQRDTGGDLHDITGLEAWLAELYAAPDLGAGDDLQIMTLHKAKGLQFDHVIIPGLGRSRAGDDRRLLAWLERAGNDGVDELLIAPIMEVGGERDPTFDFITSLERQRINYEEARLLYVGATRARESLHLFGEAKIRETVNKETVSAVSSSLLAILWPAVSNVFERALAARTLNEAEGENGSPITGIRRLPANWLVPEPPGPLPWKQGLPVPDAPGEAPEFLWASPTIRHVGTVVHLLLQRIAEQSLSEWDAGAFSGAEVETKQHLAALGVTLNDISSALELVRTAVEKTLSDERGRWLLDDIHEEARSEYRLSGVDQGKLVNVRIDRSFVDADGRRWIIDYKTSAHTGGDRDGFLDNERERYQGQLERYARIVSALDPRPIHCGLYFPLLGGWRAWQPALIIPRIDEH